MSARLMINLAPMVALLCIAAWTDIRSRRIRNWTSFPLILAGLLLSFTPMHHISPVASFSGLIVGFLLTFFMFAIGALGAGDVKLMAGVGAWVGPGPIFLIFIVNAVIGLLVVLAQAAWQGRLSKLLVNSTVLTINLVHLQDVGIEHASQTGKSCRSIEKPLPYAVTVLAAVLLVLVVHVEEKRQ